MQTKCPKCSSVEIKLVSYIGASCVVCNKCGYDETSELDLTPEYNKSQKAKGQFSPYKAGGGKRAVKK